ncbi:MAG: HPr-rel-A system PqqD family peptide chaperone [Chromatiales bacterium]
MPKRAAETVIWKSLFPEDYCWCADEQDDHVALFHPCSGNILLVTPLAEFLLKSLQQQDADEQQLLESAGRFFEIEDTDQLKQAINQSLRTFLHRGLINWIYA